MNFEQRCTVPVERERLWDFLMDVPRMAVCVPGVERVEPKGEDEYEGRMRVRVGPIGLTLDGVMRVQERDQENWRAAVRAEANDKRAGGGLHATAHMDLIENGADSTDLFIRAEARLLGRLGEFGQPLIRRKAEAMMAEFARNVADHFADG
jgi:carbon monoxide dehydrogenase subunit G